MSLRLNIELAKKRLKGIVTQNTARVWRNIYRMKKWSNNWKYRYDLITYWSLFLMVLIFMGLCFSITYEDTLAEYYSNTQSIDDLRDLILNVGSALIGATAIVTSLVLFAMQVNIERMPYGLFHKLSVDLRLLGAFSTAFILSISIALSSVLLNQAPVTWVIIGDFWATILILILFRYSYRRALTLINPREQLNILIHDTQKEFRIWTKRADRLIPLFESKEITEQDTSLVDVPSDIPRLIFFWSNIQWTDNARRSIQHAISFARNYTEQGDYEISNISLAAVVTINSSYIEAKGQTFSALTSFIENPLFNDDFIDDTLNQVRQNFKRGLVRQDEQQIIQSLQTMEKLILVYLKIDYSSIFSSRSHALLAAQHLADAIQDVAFRDMAEVLLESQKFMGHAAKSLITHGNPKDIEHISRRISSIAHTGCVKEDYRLVTKVCIGQLASIVFDLLHVKDFDIKLEIRQVHKNAVSIANSFLDVSDNLPFGGHGVFLDLYFSPASLNGLIPRLTQLANVISSSPKDDESAKLLIRNIEHWADGIYRTKKELLLKSIEVESEFTNDIIHGITELAKIFSILSNASACDEYRKENLQKHARWLVATFTFIPNSEKVTRFIRQFEICDVLFKSAVESLDFNCNEAAREFEEVLKSWIFQRENHGLSIESLRKGLFGMAILSLLVEGRSTTTFRESISKCLSERNSLSAETREQIAKAISRFSDDLVSGDLYYNPVSFIDHTAASFDSEKLQPLLKELAALLSSNIPE